MTDRSMELPELLIALFFGALVICAVVLMLVGTAAIVWSMVT